MKRAALGTALLVAALSAAVAFAASPGDASVAQCDDAAIGHGPADWRHEQRVAGPAGAMRQALSQMTQTRNGMVTKMPLLIEGREPERVTVSVPAGQRKRVFLYYGSGARSFAQSPGYAEVEFELCDNKPRTWWPGGIRVKGDAPVHLDVFTEARAEPFVLRLGRPKLYEPPS